MVDMIEDVMVLELHPYWEGQGRLGDWRQGRRLLEPNVLQYVLDRLNEVRDGRMDHTVYPRHR